MEQNFKGCIYVQKLENIVIHTYVSPEETFMVSSHIIETLQSLVIIDAQFMLEYAAEVKHYAQKLNKMVEMVIVTHAHPDHFLGLEVFSEYPLASVREVIDDIDESADAYISACQKFHANRTATQKIVPSICLSTGMQAIAGICLDLELMLDAEAGRQLLIKLPEQKVLIAQDLVYNKVHPFFAEQEIENWIAILLALQKGIYYPVVLCGHGEPCGAEVFAEMIRYLVYTQEIVPNAEDAAELKSLLMQKHPDYRATHLIDIAASYLMHGEHK